MPQDNFKPNAAPMQPQAPSARSLKGRLAEPIFTLAQIAAANEYYPSKSTNQCNRLAAVRDLAGIHRLRSSTVLDHPKIAALLHELPACGLSPQEVKRLRKEVKAALRASRLVPILAPIKMTLSPAWEEVRQCLVAPPPQMRRFMAWAHLRKIKPSEVSNHVVDAFHRDYHAIGDGNYVKNQVGEIVDALNAAGEANPALQLQALTPRITDNRRRLAPVAPSMLDDIKRFLATRVMPASNDCNDPHGNPRQIAEASADQMETELRSAIDACCLAADGHPPRLASLRDLVANYEGLVAGLCLRARERPTNYERGIGSLVRAVAAHYVKVTPDRLDEIDKAFKGLGRSKATASPARVEAFKIADYRSVMTAIAKAPQQLRFEAEAAVREDVRYRDLAAALAIDILINAPLTPAELAPARFTTTVLLPTARESRAAFRTRADRGVEQLYWLDPDCTAALVAHRAWLFARSGCEPTFLFIAPGPGSADKVMTAETLSRLVTSRLAAVTDVRLTTMQLRYLHALMLLRDNPSAIRRVQHVYGHKSLTYTKDVFSEILDKGTSEALARKARS